MKKKLLCGVLILTFFWCAPFSRIDLASGDISSPDDIKNAEEAGGLAEAEDTGNGADEETAENTNDTGGEENAEEPASQETAALPEAAPAPPPREVVTDGVYTLSLTSSIGVLTYYNQNDSRWAGQLYGDQDPLSGYGCGPTVLAMLVSSFSDQTYTPADMAKWAADNQFWSPGSGTRHNFIPDGAAAFGFNVVPFHNYTAEGIISELSSGHVLVALLGPGSFTSTGHFIIIADYWTGNQVRIADPANLENTQTPWEIETLLNELKYSANSGGPVWSISPK